MELRIIGKPTTEVISKYKNVLDCNDINIFEIILFCDYSEFDIPIGHIFSGIEIKKEKIFSGGIKLVAVSQEFALPFDLIPHGHKTICKFSITDKKIFDLLNDLPTVKDWHEINVSLIIK